METNPVLEDKMRMYKKYEQRITNLREDMMGVADVKEIIFDVMEEAYDQGRTEAKRKARQDKDLDNKPPELNDIVFHHWKLGDEVGLVTKLKEFIEENYVARKDIHSTE